LNSRLDRVKVRRQASHKETTLETLRRGVLAGAGFGLAAAVVEFWLTAMPAMQRRFAPGPGFMGRTALYEVALGAVLGVIAFPLLRPRWGRLWHALALAAVWLGLARLVTLDSPLFAPAEWIPPVAAVALLLLGAWVARLWRWVPAGIGVVALAGAIFTPHVYIRLTTPPVEPLAALPPARPEAPDVVLVVLDTVRAESVSAYGYKRLTAPTIEALAREATLFLDATAPSTFSLPAHASLFTGRFPSSHGAHAESVFLDGSFPTLAEVLAGAGYETLVFTSNAWISDGLGLTRGFRWQDDSWRGGQVGRLFSFVHRLLDRFGFGGDDKGGATIAGNFERWVQERPADAPPAFVFLNFIEAHFPYHWLPAEFLHRFTSLPADELRAISLDLLGAQFGGDPPPPEVAMGPARDMYDAGIVYADHLLSRVVEALRRRGSLDETILVVLADHGELLGERGNFYGHGPSLYEPMIRVPLLVRYPPRIPSGVRVSTPVSTVGVPATIFDLARVEPPRTLQVDSLVPVIAGERDGGAIFSEIHIAEAMGGRSRDDPLMRSDRRYRAYRLGAKKLIESSKGESWLYDLAADPEERHDLAGERPEEVARMKAEQEKLRAKIGLPALDHAVAQRESRELDPATRERLRELGYAE
jgi:arylsulfatase A-like enzyme